MKTIESNIQQSCVTWFRYQYQHFSKLLFAVPNGGFRNQATAGRLKAEGVVAGVADLILLFPNHGFHALCLEIKTDVGRQSELQRQWQAEVEKFNYKYVICRNFDDFKKQITDYLTIKELGLKTI